MACEKYQFGGLDKKVVDLLPQGVARGFCHVRQKIVPQFIDFDQADNDGYVRFHEKEIDRET